MSHTHTTLLYHCVFTTKNQRNSISRDVRGRLFPYLRGIVRNIGGSLPAVGGTANHVHMLLGLPPTLCVSDAMRLVKTNSSKWIRETFPTHGMFGWQTGYAAFTVSGSVAARVKQYIEGQEEHHGIRSFEDEIAAMAKRHGIALHGVHVTK